MTFACAARALRDRSDPVQRLLALRVSPRAQQFLLVQGGPLDHDPKALGDSRAHMPTRTEQGTNLDEDLIAPVVCMEMRRAMVFQDGQQAVEDFLDQLWRRCADEVSLLTSATAAARW